MNPKGIKKKVKRINAKPMSRWRAVVLPKVFAMRTGTCRSAGIGKNRRTPIKLKRKCAIAIPTELVFELNTAATKAVTVVPKLAPMINTATLFKPTTFLAAIGTTTDVVIVLDRIAAVVRNPHPKARTSPPKMKRLKPSGDLASRRSEINFRNTNIEQSKMTNAIRKTTTPFPTAVDIDVEIFSIQLKL